MGTLQVVATPIGNLEDVTLRALRALKEADLLLAEDTRRTRVLLDRHGIAARPRSLHSHNEVERSGEVLEALARGERVVLVSDAGTPLVSDPGERLVAAVLEAGHRVEPLPGPSAILAALVASGLPTGAFTFLGFLPRKKGERDALLARHARRPETLVLFEAPSRVAATFAVLAEAFGPERPACAARELTKLHEEVVRGSLGELAQRFAEGARGEFTLLVAGAPEAPAELADPEALDGAIRERLRAGGTPREIAAELARLAGRPRREVYARAVALREGS